MDKKLDHKCVWAETKNNQFRCVICGKELQSMQTMFQRYWVYDPDIDIERISAEIVVYDGEHILNFNYYKKGRKYNGTDEYEQTKLKQFNLWFDRPAGYAKNVVIVKSQNEVINWLQKYATEHNLVVEIAPARDTKEWKQFLQTYKVDWH